jgi:hypothetical protein
MINEVYKDIKGYEGLYQISNLGNVKSIKSKKILVQSSSSSGYKFINLRKNSKGKNFRVHRLVAETFIPNYNNLPYVNHKDENPKNNCVDNLEWCTASYNINYGDRNNKVAKKVSIWRKKKGSDYSPRKRKRVAQYTLDDKFVKEFRSINEAGRETNSSIGTIQKCCVGISHTCNGYKWKYVLDRENK